MVKLLKLFTYLLVASFIILFDFILFLGLEQLPFILQIQGAQVQLGYLGERDIYIYIYIFSLATSPYLLGEVLFGQPFYEGFGRGSCVEDAV